MNATSGNNLLIITSDEHRRDAMGCAGHPVVKTPNPGQVRCPRDSFRECLYSFAGLCSRAREHRVR